LEQQRHGSVSLAAIGVKHEEDFCLEVFSIDRLGHIAVKASLRRPNYVGGNLHPLELSSAFEMDAEKFGTFVREFEALMTQI
jgi:hypothetical protein